MRFFNLDLHIGVIGDIAYILRSLGHEVTNWSISAHTWVFDREPDKVDVVNEHTWKSIDRTMCDAFYERYRRELESYDAFIVTHTPTFAMLYERWGKPILCVASTRYEHPYSNNRVAWENFNEFLRSKIDSGMLIPLANNRYDADYAEYFTGRPWQVIPSLCEYTKASYTGVRSESLFYSKFPDLPPIEGVLSRDGFFKRTLLERAFRKIGIRFGKRGYTWTDLYTFRSIIHIPYNASVMSIFEMYSAAVPMLFPSLRFAMELYPANNLNGVFSELSYNQVCGLPSGSVLPSDERDPNNYEDADVMAHWIAKSDFYDAANMPGLVYFDSFAELREQLHTLDINAMYERMTQHNMLRKQAVYTAWKGVMNRVQTMLFRTPLDEEEDVNNQDLCSQ